ncbi:MULTISPECIES: ion channel [unclassified Streptomyces]|uniref:ion channel n=1 Tax=unclassified Streptomyces TaxID=2593676 RepID=UPI003247C992
MSVALLVLAGAVAWQVLSISRADYPAVRAVEALSVTTPLFLLLFAAAYYILAQDDPANFSSHTLTRTDTLYFTVSTFTTVGFGDITATSEAAHLIVTVQILLDLLVLGLGFRLFFGAVRTGQGRLPDTATDAPS